MSTTIVDDKEREAFERIERKFKSDNNVEVERAVITKKDWELAKSFIEKTEYEKIFLRILLWMNSSVS